MDGTPGARSPVKSGAIADGALRLLTLDRPDRANALDAVLVAALFEGLASAASKGVPLALTGEGRAFCGGFDLTGVEHQSDGDLVLRFVRIEALLQALHHAPVATFALINGPAYGAGADLVVACAYRVGCRESKFRFPGFRFGVALGTRRLANIVGGDRARATLLGDRTIGAEEALEIGLLTHLVDRGQLEATAAELLDGHRGLPPTAATRILSLTAPDTRDADMADLVRSLFPDGLRERIERYRAGR